MDSPELLVEPAQQIDAEPVAALPVELATVYEEHSRPIYYLCLRLLADPSMAQDATHDVFLKAWRGLGTFRGDAQMRTWLYRIAINHCQNLRSSWAHRNIHGAEDDTIESHAAPPSDCPLRVIETRELGERIQRTLDELPEQYRLVLLLVADEELSYDAVGELTGQSSDAVRGKLHRARKLFSQLFAKTA
jgi:RNA polymerase sigma-70 factor, ECF subfamily